MNIEKAIERVKNLTEKIAFLERQIEAANKSGQGRQADVIVSVFVQTVGEKAVAVDRESAIRLLTDTRDALKQETAKLQPVIDMANAALKGILQ